MRCTIFFFILLIFFYKSFAADSSFAANDKRIMYAPYVWYNGKGFKETINPGAYLRIAFKGSSVKLLVEEDSLLADPYIRIMIDGLPPKDTRLKAGQKELIVCDSLAKSLHEVEIIYDGRGDFYTNSWHREQRFKITSIQVSGGGLLQARQKNKKAVFFGDSITEAIEVGGVNNNLFRNGVNAYPRLASYALNMEWGQVGFGGLGWAYPSAGGVPTLPESWPYYSHGISRLVKGNLTPAPDYVFINLGTNDFAHKTNASPELINMVLEQMRQAAPSSYIFVIVPFGRFFSEENKQAVLLYQQVHKNDNKVLLIDLGNEGETGVSTLKPNIYSADGGHPNAEAHGRLGALLAGKVLEIIHKSNYLKVYQ